MLIVLTQDQGIINWCQNPKSGARRWGLLNVVNAGGAPGASVELRGYLREAGSDEPLCVTGHGNNEEIGDAESSGKQSWSWRFDEFANYLVECLPSGYQGVILMEVCAESLTSFAANLADSLRRANHLKGVWIYGYVKAVSVTHTFPDPTTLDKNVELSGHRA